MAISIGDLQIVLSGGGGNASQAASLGGAISTSKVISQTTTAPNLVTGVTILDAMGNAEGVGTLKWDTATTSLMWKPFGGTAFNGLVITDSGTYTIGSTSGYIIVSVVAASLPGSTVQDSITVSNATNRAFDNITAMESLNGDAEYRCFYVKNTHATQTAYDVRLWVKSQPTGSDTLAVALDPNGKNISARGPIVDEEDSTNVLTGIVFTQPNTYAGSLVIGTLGPGDYYPFWVKRVVPSNTTTAMVNDFSSLAISALI